MNFLVVDDNRLLNRFLTTFLRSKGHGASSLTDGSKVEAWLAVNPCDGIILDIGMPKIDGLTLISVIRVNYPDLPIVMFTGLGYDEEAMQVARKACERLCQKVRPVGNLFRGHPGDFAAQFGGVSR